MRWKEKEKKIKKIGDRRKIKRFLFFPKKIKGEWRWLEICRILQERIECVGTMPEGGAYDAWKWKNIEWLD